MPRRDLESRITTRQGPTWSRRRWRGCTWFLTWWIPSPVLKLCGFKRQDIRDAWREKVAIFIIIMTACLGVLFFIIVLPRLICPKEDILGRYEIEEFNKLDKAYVTVNGRYFDVTEIANSHIGKIGVDKFKMQSILGADVSQMFYPTKNWDAACPGISNPGDTWDNILERDPEKFWPHYQVDSRTNSPQNYLGFLAKYAKGRIGWQPDYVSTLNDPTKKVIMMFGNVYDVAAYFQGQSAPGFFDDNMYKIFTNAQGKDASQFMQTLLAQDPVFYRNVLNCMNNIFYIGTVDNRNSMRCQLSNWILLGASAIIVAVIGVKFLSALRSMHTSDPGEINKFVIVQVPCYTEGKESLELTLNSIAKTTYNDQFKLAIVICDGMITGGGNNKPTPDIVLDILYGGEQAAEEAKRTARKPMTYHAIGEGMKALNEGQIYSGLYEHEGHNLPFMVIVKTGNEHEMTKKGNRGKRDSQILLMRFLHNVYARNHLTELEYEMLHHMKDIMGMDPEKFEFTLMVDADTKIEPDSLTKMVSSMVFNRKIIGLCGETFVANEKASLATMIQVYEYFISHHLAKAFESMFGSVTCLPGCFCMYRLRTERNVPLLIAPALIEEYADPHVDTLHKKNLLSLGEDRYLTTLILKHFPRNQTMFIPDAQCYTNAPDSFSVLMSQRRRWINSTVHNLVELSNMGAALCGFCCFSMRFVVILDLLSTVVAPASVVYVFYLVYVLIFEQVKVPTISLIMIGSIYGLQAIVFLLKGKWEQIGWMFIYILAMPYFSFWMPLKSFWNMDDFNWGNTRVVINESGKTEELGEGEGMQFDVSKIVRKKYGEWQTERDAETNEKIKENPFDIFDSPIQKQNPFDAPVYPATAQMSMLQPTFHQTFNPTPVFQNPYQQAPYAASYYAPSHVASYVGEQYPPPPLSYRGGDSNWGGSQYNGMDNGCSSGSSSANERRMSNKERKSHRQKKKQERRAERREKRETMKVGLEMDNISAAPQQPDFSLPQITEQNDFASDDWSTWANNVGNKDN